MKKIIAYGLSVMILLSLFPRMESRAEGEIIQWLSKDTMDIQLNLIEGKAGADDLLFELSMEESGTYQIEYFLQDQEKTTLALINGAGEVTLQFQVNKGTSGTSVNGTENLMNLSFLSVDYTPEIPTWKSYTGAALVQYKTDHLNGNGQLEYKIDKKASNKYPGAAFKLNNKTFMFKMDFNSEKAYLYMDRYKDGHIFPISVTTPEGVKKELNILKNLNKFQATPTHWIVESGANKDETLISVPNADSHKAGSKPGIRIEFEHPKAINTTSWQFDFPEAETLLKDMSAILDLKDLAGDDYLDIQFALDTAQTALQNVPEGNAGGVNYSYDGANNLYQIEIVKDKTGLQNPTKFLQWSGIDKSKIYKTAINLAEKAGTPSKVTARPFSPAGEFAYTYMEYTLKRADQKEAYLEITPYAVGDDVDLEYTVLYSKTFVSNMNATQHRWLKHYQKNDDAQGKINIPVPFLKDSNGDHYKILFRFSSTEIASQTLNYKAKADTEVPPAMPEIISLDNIYVVPPAIDAIDQNEPTQIQFDLTFNAIEKSELDKLFAAPAVNPAVYYELSVNTLPGETEQNQYKILQVYKVIKDGGKYKLTAHPALTTDTYLGKPVSAGKFVDGYDQENERFRIENIVLSKNGTRAPSHQASYDENTKKYTVAPAAVDSKIDLLFPGVNYLRLRAYTEEGGNALQSRASMPESFSLSMLTHQVPTVNQLRYEPLYDITKITPEGVAIYWDWNKNKADLKNYEEGMLTPLKKKVQSIKYVGYISQDRSKLMQISSDDREVELTLLDGVDQSNKKIEVTSANLTGFREGKVFYFEFEDGNVNSSTGAIPGGEFVTQIRGLDPNEIYYARFVVELQVKNEDGTLEQDVSTPSQPKPRMSTPSVILEMTVPKVNPEPGDNEKLPLAPDAFRVDFLDESKVQSFAEWDFPSTITPKDENYGFELLNVEDQSLVAGLRLNELSMEELMLGTSTDENWKKTLEQFGIHQNKPQAFRIYNANAEKKWKLQEYDVTAKAWVDTQQADFSMEGNRIRLIDKKNSPNRVLYYYVRTIKFNENYGVAGRSPWREATLTTPELKRPINLVVDYTSTIDHHPTKERIIYFDVPIPEGVKLHTDYLVQIFVQGEKDREYIQTNLPVNGNVLYGSTWMKEAKADGVNYKRLYYKVYNLEPGKAYDIKVRLEDRTKDQEQNPDGTFSYATSPFSDVVRTRTEFDQVTHQKEEILKEYLEHYQNRAENLKKNPFFPIEANLNKSVYKYRSSYMVGELRNHSGTDYPLVEGEANHSVYYLPSEIIRRAPDFQTAISAVLQKQKLFLPAGFLLEEETPALKNAIKKIKEFNSTAKDYVVMLELKTGKYVQNVNGKQPMEPMFSVGIQVIRTNRTEESIDKMLTNAMDSAIAKNKNLLIQELEKDLKLGIREDKLNQITNQVIAGVEKDFSVKAQHQFYSALTSEKDYLRDLENAMIVALKPKTKDAYLVYHREASEWLEIVQNEKQKIRSSRTGSFIAVKDEITQEISANLGETEKNAIQQYGLYRVFEAKDFQQNPVVQGSQLIRTAARILGAKDGNDTVSFLKAQGIILPKYDNTKGISREKAFSILGQVYEKKKGISLKKVKLTQFAEIEDSKDLDSKLETVVLAGYQLGLWESENGNIMPKAAFAMKDLMIFLRQL